MKRILAVILLSSVLISACAGSGDSSLSDNLPNSENEGNQNTPQQTLSRLLAQGITVDDFSTYFQGTWKIYSFPINDVPAINENPMITLGANGEVNTFQAPPLFNYEPQVYHAPVPGIENDCAEIISNAPDEGIYYAGDTLTLFDGTITYTITDTGVSPILRFIITWTSYPSCCGGDLGACADSGFDPTPHQAQRVNGYVINGADENAFVLEANGYYALLIRQ